jgi:CBS domain-containing protein
MAMNKVKNLVKKAVVISLPPKATVYEAANIMSSNKVSYLVIKDSDRLVGIFTDRDLKNRVIAKNLDYKETNLSAVMTKAVETIGMEDDLEDCLISMKLKSCHHLPVLHKDKVVAVLTKGYVVNQMLGEIKSERDALTQYVTGANYIDGEAS